jgi:phosphatidylglycerol:prolipoprotein diacylglycerol transferase
MHPILFHLGPVPVYSFGLFVTLGFIAGIALAYRLAKRDGLPAEGIVDASVWILLGSIAGARLFFVLLNWTTFNGHWIEALSTWRGGMTFHGGLVGGVLTGAVYAWRKRLPFWALADAVAPGLALGYAVGRIGCLLNGCCYGGPTNLPWAMVFRDTDHGGFTPPSHPVQIYASLINLGICGLLIAIYRRRVVTGQVLVSYLVLYSLYRFGVEFLRKGFTAQEMAFGLTQAQVASLAVAAAGTAALIVMLRTARARRTGRPGPAGVAEAAPVK